MRKPQFGLITGLLTIFFILALIRINFEKYIPQLPPNKLANRPGFFLRVAVHQPIDWQPSPTDAFSRATILNRPVLFVVGSGCSQLGALMDSRVFSNWSVATEINNAFVPVRVDLEEHPEWKAAIFPVSRARTPFLDSFQIFTIDPQTRLERVFDPPQDLSQVDPATFLDLLTTNRRDFDDQTAKNLSPAEELQHEDIAELASQSPRQLPGFQQFANALSDSTSPTIGAFAENGFLKMLPDGWLYLCRVDRRATLVASLNRFLLSPCMDVLRGGFFDIDESHEDLTLNFAEKTVDNAQIASTLAEAGETMHQEFFSVVAQRTFDMIMRDLSDGQLLASCRPSDEDLTTGKSASSSHSNADLNQLLPANEVTWANENLNPGQNRQQVLFLSNQSSIIAPDLEKICHRLRLNNRRSNATDQDLYLDINGNALASLCRCARIWGDGVRLKQVRNSVGNLESFTSGLEISHTRQPAEPSALLSDYLAFADAQLQFYLATGESSHYMEGREALIRAVKTFLAGNGRLLSFENDDHVPMPTGFNNPQINDPGPESTTAQAIRLCLAYGRMMGPTKEGNFLTKMASDQVSKYASLSTGTSPSLAGYYLSSAELSDPLCAFAVGPNAVDQANELFRRRPARLVSPVNRYVRPDLADRAPGIYVVSGTLVSGPFTVDKAAHLLPPFYQVGVAPEAG